MPGSALSNGRGILRGIEEDDEVWLVRLVKEWLHAKAIRV